jgi:hypothetical protein
VITVILVVVCISEILCWILALRKPVGIKLTAGGVEIQARTVKELEELLRLIDDRKSLGQETL